MFKYDHLFSSTKEICQHITGSRNYKPEEDPKKAKALRIFQTRRQQTWLITTHKRLYCLLENRDEDKVNVNFSIRKSKLVGPEDKIIVDLETSETSPPKRKTGLVKIGKHKNWLYTKKLFEHKSIEDSIKELVLVMGSIKKKDEVKK